MITETRDTGSPVVAVLVLLAAMGLYLLLDMAVAASLNPVISGGFALTALALGFYVLNSLPLRQRMLLVGMLVTAVFAVRYVDWDERKPFLRDFYQIQPGMTAAEVDAVMQDYVKQVSPFVARSAEGLVQTGAVSYQQTADAAGDADFGLITFAGGRVVGRTFYPN